MLDIVAKIKTDVHTVVQRFRRNLHGFWSTYRWLIIIFVIAQFCDALSTCYFMNKTSWKCEFHPVFRQTARLFGVLWGPLIGYAYKISIGIAIAIYARKFASMIFLSSSIIAIFAAAHNIWFFNGGYEVVVSKCLSVITLLV